MAPLKLYVISQTVNGNYDTFDGAVVAAKNAEDARGIVSGCGGDAWCLPKDVEVELIGTATTRIKKGVVLDSFNAG